MGVFSIDTYQTTEAPGLDELRVRKAGLTVKEMRALLSQGGPGMLLQQLQKTPPYAQAALHLHYQTIRLHLHPRAISWIIECP
jgi:hypothetical protein